MNQQIYREASDWFVRMRDGDTGPAAQGALMSWLKRSPDHVSAYLDIAAIWREAARSEVDSQFDRETRIAIARADEDVPELHPTPVLREDRPARGAYRYLALAASVFIVVGGLWFASTQQSAPGYATGFGEIRSLKLADGSTVELNSGSRIEVRFGDAERRIELLEGQALFRVEKDPTRPFIVTTSGVSVRAVGTAFDIYRRKADAVVTVLEGSVAVAPAGSSPAVLLTAGKQAVVEHESVLQPKSVNVAAATAWTRRQLIFEFTPLQEVVDEFNRYNTRKLTVDSEQLRGFRISALFESTEPHALVEFLRSTPGVEVKERNDSISITSDGRGIN
jgi:transmembrane sensor